MGVEITTYYYRVFVNFNYYGRFIHIETWLGDNKKFVIILKAVFNMGWGDIADKIIHFLGKRSTNRYRPTYTQQTKSYVDTAKIAQWTVLTKATTREVDNATSVDSGGESHHFLARCLVGTFNDPFNYSPNQEVIQKWFVNRWRICAGMRVTPMSHNQFLFELPSRQEDVRVHVGDWFWNGRRLSLQWWSAVVGTKIAC